MIFHISCFRKLKKEAIDLAKKGFLISKSLVDIYVSYINM